MRWTGRASAGDSRWTCSSQRCPAVSGHSRAAALVSNTMGYLLRAALTGDFRTDLIVDFSADFITDFTIDFMAEAPFLLLSTCPAISSSFFLLMLSSDLALNTMSLFLFAMRLLSRPEGRSRLAA